MKVIIECYGASRRWISADEVELDLADGATGDDALDALADRYPEFAVHRERVAIAIGNAIAAPGLPLSDGVRVALIPPVSAG